MEQPKNGTAEIRNGDLIYTPAEDFRGEERISVVIQTPEGTTETVKVTVAVGKEQTLATDWTAPKRLKPGVHQFGPSTFITNANQAAKVSVTCSIIKKWVSPNPAPVCEVVPGKGGTYLSLTVYEPTFVEVTLKAPKKGKYRPMEEKYSYRVNP